MSINIKGGLSPSGKIKIQSIAPTPIITAGTIGDSRGYLISGTGSIQNPGVFGTSTVQQLFTQTASNELFFVVSGSFLQNVFTTLHITGTFTTGTKTVNVNSSAVSQYLVNATPNTIWTWDSFTDYMIDSNVYVASFS
jgi:hypothetical protein